jgi:polysaccharide chain length determinant protein (PEP-CTERM system associated)
VDSQVSPEHYLRLILHRKWLIIGTFLLVTAITIGVSHRLPDIYSSETLIMVDPQKVPDSYVKATVTGDVRNRLGTLSQQILSTTRLQKIIDTLSLYPTEKKTLAREEIITKMRKDISVSLESGSSQDLQAFRIMYRGRDPRLVAQVANELATQFIDENLKARELQATGTNEFLQSQLNETRKTLEAQEAKLRDFRLRHIGEMPEQQNADLQILGQLRSQLQLEGESLARAEQQKSYLQSTMTQAAPVVDLDGQEQKPFSDGAGQSGKAADTSTSAAPSKLANLQARLNSLQGRYTDQYPEIRKLRQEIADEEAKERTAKPAPPAEVAVSADPPPSTPAPSAKRALASLPRYVNPVLQSQLRTVEDEIAKHKQEQERLNKLASGYQGKLEAIPVREQEIADLVRDYEISKAHYQQLLNNQLSAETATQLEIRQKGEKFSILDPAQPAGKPSSPNRKLINLGGGLAGLALGLALALVTELMGISIIVPEQLVEVTGGPLLEVIPVIRTYVDRRQKRRLILAAVVTLLASGTMLFYRYRS